MSMLKITVCIVTYNEKGNIGDCLKSVYDMDYPPDLFEVLVVDGGSDDGTIDIVRDYQKIRDNLRLIIDHRKGTAVARRVGVEEAQSDYIAFTDADCEVPPDWLIILVNGFSRYAEGMKNLAAVGGKNENRAGAGFVTRAISVATNTYAGSFGSVQGMAYDSDREVSSLATLNALYSRKALMGVGNFDPELISDAEDADINFRLREAGYKFMYLAQSTVYHKYRPTLTAWARNMIRYGRGRARLLKKHREMWSPRYALPVFFLLSFLLLPFGYYHAVFLLPLFYFPLFLAYSALLGWKRESSLLLFHIFSVFVATHFSYAFGLTRELCRR